MAIARKLGRSGTPRIKRLAAKSVRPTLDVKASFDDLMRRYPKKYLSMRGSPSK